MVKMSDYFAFLCRLPDLKISISHVRFSLTADVSSMSVRFVPEADITKSALH